MKWSRLLGSRLLVSLMVVILVTASVGCSQPAAPTPTITQAPKAAPTKESKQEATPAAASGTSKAQPAAKEAAKVPAKLTKLTVPYASISGGLLPLWVTKEKGLFEKYGLDAELEYIATSTTMTQAMVAGQITLAETGGNAIISADLAGADLVQIAGTANVLAFFLFAQPNIQRIEDLKGKTLGITRFGANTDFAARYTLRKYGLEPGKDVAIVEVGGVPETMAAMKAGGIQATVTGPPNSMALRKAGMRELVNIIDLGIPYSFIAYAASKKYLAGNREIVMSFLKALVEGSAVAKKEKEFSMNVLGKYTKTEDKDVQQEAYDVFITKLLPRAPYTPVESMQFVLDDMAQTNTKAKGAKPESFVDNSLIKEIDDSGFIKSLY